MSFLKAGRMQRVSKTHQEQAKLHLSFWVNTTFMRLVGRNKMWTLMNELDNPRRCIIYNTKDLIMEYKLYFTGNTISVLGNVLMQSDVISCYPSKFIFFTQSRSSFHAWFLDYLKVFDKWSSSVKKLLMVIFCFYFYFLYALKH